MKDFKIVRVKYLDHVNIDSISIDDILDSPEVILVAYGELLHEDNLYLVVRSWYNSVKEPRGYHDNTPAMSHRIVKGAIIERVELLTPHSLSHTKRRP